MTDLAALGAGVLAELPVDGIQLRNTLLRLIPSKLRLRQAEDSASEAV